MRIRADVVSPKGESTNYIGSIVDGNIVRGVQLPNPVRLEISEEEGAFFLFYLDANDNCFADSWHQTLESAKQAAFLGFGINPDQWRTV